MIRTGLAAVAVAAVFAAGGAQAQVTPAMKAKIAEIGRVVDPPSTALVYRPLHGSPPYAGVTVVRDQSYGPDARNILDEFTPASGAAARTVLIHVSGGAGNKIEPVPQGDAFYDNIMLWAAKNGMVGVNIQRRAGPAWDASGTDVGLAIAWVKKNIARFGGDPARVFVWGHSAGAQAVSVYLSHPNLYGPEGIGVKGAIMMAGPYNISPVTVDAPGISLRMGPGAPVQTFPAGAPPVAQSVLPGLKALTIPLFLAEGELEPPQLNALGEALNKELCAAGKCPKHMVFKDHGHMSEMFAVNTADTSTSAPVLEFIRSVK